MINEQTRKGVLIDWDLCDMPGLDVARQPDREVRSFEPSHLMNLDLTTIVF